MGGASAADRNTSTAAATGDRTKGGAPGARGDPRSSTEGQPRDASIQLLNTVRAVIQRRARAVRPPAAR